MDPAAYFRTQARECRRLAEPMPRGDRQAMLSLARHYDREAVRAQAEPIEAPLPRA